MGEALVRLLRRPVVNATHVLMVAIGIGALAFLLLVERQLETWLARETRGIDLIVGTKGRPLQLVSSAVLQLGPPTGKITKGDADIVRQRADVALAVSIELGDRALGADIVGTERDYFALLGANVVQGRLFEAPFEAVIGSTLARAADLGLGAEFTGTHGSGVSGQEHARPYRVVGILAPTGRAIDRSIVTSLDSLWEIHSPQIQREGRFGALTSTALELTALLVRSRTSTGVDELHTFVHDETPMQAASPADEFALVRRLVGWAVLALRAAALVFLASAVLGILAGLGGPLANRGPAPWAADRWRAIRVALFEALTLTLLGSVLGLALAHGGIEVLVCLAPEASVTGLTAYFIDQREVLLIVGTLLVVGLAAPIPTLRAASVS